MNRQPSLVGELVEVRPLRDDDFDELYRAAADPLLWEQHPSPDRWRRDVFRSYFDDHIASGGALAIVDRATGSLIGATRYDNLDAETGEVEIGWTFLARPYWGGAYNADLKRIMLEHAFESCEKVVFLVGEQNMRSRHAVEKLGAVETGRRRGQVLYELRRPSRAAELYVAAFTARFGREHDESTIRLVVTDDCAYDRLARGVPHARHGSVTVFDAARRCAELMRAQPGWKAERPSTGMVHGNIDALPEAPLPEGLALRAVDRLGTDAADAVPLADAAAVAIASDPGITEPAAEFAQFLRGLSGSARLFAAVDGGGAVRATSGCEVYGEYARLFFVNTLPSWRGRGVGRAMTIAALKDAGRAGARRATLDATDAGAALYDRLGFESAGRMVRYFPAK